MSKTSFAQLEQFLFRRNGKYPTIGVSAALIHLCYLYFFYRIGYTPMATYNIFSIAGYIFFSAEAYKGNKIKAFYFYSILEIPLHAFICTLLVGWNYRFMLIVAFTIPLNYYFTMFIDNFKSKIIIPTFVSVVYAGLYLGTRVASLYYTPIIGHYKAVPKYEMTFTYFNTMVSFTVIIFFNTLIAIEYSYVKKKLINENTVLGDFATYDPLTNLLNRRSVDVELKRLYDDHYHDEDAFSVIMCDIDKFKSVNDTYGHDCGDFVLKEVSWILKDQVRDGDIVGRWGGEEFLILLKCNKTNAAILAERIRAKVEAHSYKYKDYDLHVTITLGVSSYHANTDIKSLIKSADQKLYRGKENGRNQVVS